MSGMTWNWSGMVEGMCTNISNHSEVRNISLAHGINEMNKK